MKRRTFFAVVAGAFASLVGRKLPAAPPVLGFTYGGAVDPDTVVQFGSAIPEATQPLTILGHPWKRVDFLDVSAVKSARPFMAYGRLDDGRVVTVNLADEEA